MNLHSSMVRLETYNECITVYEMIEFTFQYGQIRNELEDKLSLIQRAIYIPVWLDQKLALYRLSLASDLNLHSSMVRLET